MLRISLNRSPPGSAGVAGPSSARPVVAGARLAALGRLGEASARRARVGALIMRWSPREAAAEVQGLVEQAMRGDREARDVTIDLAAWLFDVRAPASLVEDPTRPARARALAAIRAAADQGFHAAAAILAQGDPARALPALGRLREVCLDADAPLPFTPWRGLRAGPNLLLLDRLLAHHDARMIRRVLSFPHLCPADAAFIAARRPTSKEIARAVARSRWVRRPEVRAALVENPFTPVEIAAPLLPTVSAATLRRLRDRGAAGPGIARLAGVLLACAAPPREEGGCLWEGGARRLG